MKPLLFLTTRTFVNGLRRSLTSPQRLIGILFIAVSWGARFLRTAFGTVQQPTIPTKMPFQIPSQEVLETIAFALFVGLTIILMLGALTPRNSFKPSDVDVLFPTPVNPKLVLTFRIVRDYLATQFMAILLAVVSIGSSPAVLRWLFRSYPDHGALITRAITVSWLLSSFAWVCLGVGTSLFLNRGRPKSEYYRRVVFWGIAGVLVLVAGYATFMFRASPSLQTGVALAHNPLIRIVFFTATASTYITMGALAHSFGSMGLGVLILLGATALGLWIAATQVSYMYDQAATRGFGSVELRKLQRSGDIYALRAEHARQGKVKSGRLAGWISRWNPTGALALVWKELLLQVRGAMWQYLIFAPIILFMVLLPLWGMKEATHEPRAENGIFLLTIGFGVLMMTLQNATSGFLELLRRIDTQRPLPFTPMATVSWEVVAKTVPTSIVIWFACFAAIVMDPAIWDAAIAGMIIGPSIALILAAVVLLLTLLFPDIDDAAQRGFRGMMILLGSAMACLPGLLIIILVMALGGSPLIGAPFVFAVDAAITLLLTTICGNLYASFNPTE